MNGEQLLNEARGYESAIIERRHYLHHSFAATFSLV